MAGVEPFIMVLSNRCQVIISVFFQWVSTVDAVKGLVLRLDIAIVPTMGGDEDASYHLYDRWSWYRRLDDVDGGRV